MHCRAMLNNHSIDFNDAHEINKGHFRLSETLGYWHTAITSREPVIRHNCNYLGHIDSVMNTLAFFLDFFSPSNLLFLLYCFLPYTFLPHIFPRSRFLLTFVRDYRLIIESSSNFKLISKTR